MLIRPLVLAAALGALSVLPAAAGAATPDSTPETYRLSADVTLRGARLTVHVRLREASRFEDLAGATVRVRGRTTRTDADGIARLRLLAAPSRPLRVIVGKRGLRRLAVTVPAH